MKFNNWLRKNRNLLIIIGVIGLIIVGILGYSGYSNYIFEQKIINITFGNAHIDPDVITYIRMEEFTPVTISLYSNSNIGINELEDSVLATLSSDEFILDYKFSGSPSFSGLISINGLKKLANNSKVESIDSSYGETQASGVE